MPESLPVSKLILAAIVIPWEMRKRMTRALIIPVTVSSIIGAFLHYAGEDLGVTGSIPFGLIQLALYSIFAITCHRLVLIGSNAVSDYGILSWSRRETRFFLWSIGLSVLYALGMMLPMMLFLIAGSLIIDSDPNNWVKYSSYLFLIPATYIFSRLSLIFPATAIDEHSHPGWAWELSRNNGWRLTFIVGILPLVLAHLESLLLRENATLPEVILLTVFGFILLAVEIAALSLSYNTPVTSQHPE